MEFFGSPTNPFPAFPNFWVYKMTADDTKQNFHNLSQPFIDGFSFKYRPHTFYSHSPPLFSPRMGGIKFDSSKTQNPFFLELKKWVGYAPGATHRVLSVNLWHAGFTDSTMAYHCLCSYILQNRFCNVNKITFYHGPTL